MGPDPRASVVDANLRAHDVPNLYLVGSGCFVTASSSPPTLTIVALAIRAAEHIAARLRAGLRRLHPVQVAKNKAEARSVTSGKVSGSFSSWRRDVLSVGLSIRVLNFRKPFQAFPHPRHIPDRPLLTTVIRFTIFHLWHVWCTYLPMSRRGDEGYPA